MIVLEWRRASLSPSSGHEATRLTFQLSGFIWWLKGKREKDLLIFLSKETERKIHSGTVYMAKILSWSSSAPVMMLWCQSGLFRFCSALLHHSIVLSNGMRSHAGPKTLKTNIRSKWNRSLARLTFSTSSCLTWLYSISILLGHINRHVTGQEKRPVLDSWGGGVKTTHHGATGCQTQSKRCYSAWFESAIVPFGFFIPPHRKCLCKLGESPGAFRKIAGTRTTSDRARHHPIHLQVPALERPRQVGLAGRGPNPVSCSEEDKRHSGEGREGREGCCWWWSNSGEEICILAVVHRSDWLIERIMDWRTEIEGNQVLWTSMMDEPNILRRRGLQVGDSTLVGFWATMMMFGLVDCYLSLCLRFEKRNIGFNCAPWTHQ